MIVPVAGEDAWLEWLSSTPIWHSPSKAAVVVFPHPDDEVPAVRGLIDELRRNNFDVQVIAVTAGEGACPTARNLRSVRTTELNASLVCLHLPHEKVIGLQVVLLAPWSCGHHMESLNGLDVRRFPLNGRLLDAKTRPLACRQSQLSWPGEKLILHGPLLKPFTVFRGLHLQ